jgi:hypothetical protein
VIPSSLSASPRVSNIPAAMQLATKLCRSATVHIMLGKYCESIAIKKSGIALVAYTAGLKSFDDRRSTARSVPALSFSVVSRRQAMIELDHAQSTRQQRRARFLRAGADDSNLAVRSIASSRGALARLGLWMQAGAECLSCIALLSVLFLVACIWFAQ